jgi:hypothetical protein
MKYAQFLKNVDERAPPQLRGKFIRCVRGGEGEREGGEKEGKGGKGGGLFPSS